MPKQTFYYGNRRAFLKSTSLAASAAVFAPYLLRAQGTNNRINIACIGVGGKGGSDTDSAYKLGGNIVALCDVDGGTLNGKDKALKDRAAKEIKIPVADDVWEQSMTKLSPGIHLKPGELRIEFQGSEDEEGLKRWYPEGEEPDKDKK